METIRRIFNAPSDSFFLFGPRGTGKSTFVKEKFPDALYIDLLLPDNFRLYQSKPERLRELIFGNPQKNKIIIDEIQKIPDLLSVVHSIIEEKLNIQFILTGSSPRKLKRSGVNLLAGRALLRYMHGFSAIELNKSFNLIHALSFGTIPLVINSSNPKDKLKAYIDIYLKEEVLMEGLTRNVGNFTRFLETISFSHASVLNINNLARECEVERKTVNNYIEILEDLLLAYRIPVFTKRAQRAVITHPKFYLFDVGVFQTLRPKGPLDNPSEISGVALEGLVAQEIIARLNYLNNGSKLFFWRTRAGSEVDFIVYGENNFLAIEVKISTKIHSKDLNHLKTFSSDYPEAVPILLYLGKESLLINNIKVLPCEEFLLNINTFIK